LIALELLLTLAAHTLFSSASAVARLTNFQSWSLGRISAAVI
jgi:hypothetical protein